MAYEAIESMAKYWYREWYRKDVSPHLTPQQKEAVLKRISDLTLDAPIWLDRKTDFTPKFPELRPYVNTKISGLELVSVMEAIFKELHPEIVLP